MFNFNFSVSAGWLLLIESIILSVLFVIIAGYGFDMNCELTLIKTLYAVMIILCVFMTAALLSPRIERKVFTILGGILFLLTAFLLTAELASWFTCPTELHDSVAGLPYRYFMEGGLNDSDIRLLPGIIAGYVGVAVIMATITLMLTHWAHLIIERVFYPEDRA